MKYTLLHFIICIFQTTVLFGQKMPVMKIEKINGSYSKTLKLPVDARILKYNDEVIVLSLDSIKNGYWFGNKGKDSVAIGDIKIVNLRGLKEIIKYSSVTACAVITLGATYFTIYAFNYPVVIDGNNQLFKYIGLGYMATFGSLGTTLYLYPRTRFNKSKYKFQTD